MRLADCPDGVWRISREAEVHVAVARRSFVQRAVAQLPLRRAGVPLKQVHARFGSASNCASAACAIAEGHRPTANPWVLAYGGRAHLSASARCGVALGLCHDPTRAEAAHPADAARHVITPNTAVTRLDWHIGDVIGTRQERAGSGAKVIDRPSHDLRHAFPDMGGLS